MEKNSRIGNGDDFDGEIMKIQQPDGSVVDFNFRSIEGLKSQQNLKRQSYLTSRLKLISDDPYNFIYE